jgi:hypothetical protein
MDMMNRRNFFRSAIALTLGFSVPVLRKASLAMAAPPVPRGDKPTLREDDPAAKKQGYSYDAMQVDIKKWKKKAGPDGDNQKCVTCKLYTMIDGNHGNCETFPKNTVNWNGWCNSWAKKA